MTCTEYGARLFAQCARMSSEVVEPSPNFGLMTVVIVVLAGALVLDVLWELTRSAMTR